MDTLRIVSTNYNGQSAVITFYPDTGGTINLGTQVLPYDYVAPYFYGTYSLFFPTFGSTCTLYVEDLSGNFLLQENGDYIFQENYSKIIIETGPSPTPSPTLTPTVTPTPTPTPSRPAYLYYRWQITESKTSPPNANCVQASEFVFQIGGVDQSMAGVTVTNPSGNNPVGEEPSKLVDGSLTTKSLDLNFVTNGNITNFIFQFSSAKAFTGYRWGTANDEESRDPKSWTIAGSNNGTTWTTLHTVSGFSATATRNTYQTAQTY